MVTHLRRNLVAYLALFVALGGTSYAAINLPAGSVGTKQLKSSAVTLTKISKKARASLRGMRGKTGSAGPQGTPGPGAQKIVFNAPASGTAATPLGTVGAYTLTARCTTSPGGSGATLDVRASGPPGQSDGSYVRDQNSVVTSGVTSTAVPTLNDDSFAGATASAGNYDRIAQSLNLISASHSVFLHLVAVADASGVSHVCHLSATAVPLP